MITRGVRPGCDVTSWHALAYQAGQEASAQPMVARLHCVHMHFMFALGPQLPCPMSRRRRTEGI